MNRTLLVEEGDDDGGNRQDKKKREKEKFPDVAEKKKKMAFKKADGKKEHNNSITGSSKVQPAEMADMAAVNPDADGITSPVGSPAINLPGANIYQGQSCLQNIIIPPPPRPVTQQLPPQHLQQKANWPQQPQQMAAIYMVPTQQPQFIPTAFQSPGPPQQQIPGQFVGQAYQPGHFVVPQYHQASGTPVQGVVYSGPVVAGPHPTHVLTKAQSLPSSATPGGDLAHNSGWVTQPSASPPPKNSTESSWVKNSAEPREERTWKDGDNPANTNNSYPVNNSQWAAFSPEESSNHANSFVFELDEEHSSSDEDVDRSSSPELAGEEGEVLLRAPSLASFAESISSLEEESEDNIWQILPEQREYYTKQFKRLQPVEDGLVQGPRARDFFMKSSLPVEVLSKIWHLSDINKDNALNLDEFCIAMHLVVALRHGLELPSTLPAVLLPGKKETGVGVHAHPLETQQQTEKNEEHEVGRNVSSPEHWLRFTEPHHHAVPSPPASFSNSSMRRKAHSVVQPVPQRADLEGDEHSTEKPRSLSDPTLLEDSAVDGASQRTTNLASPKPVNPLHIVMPQSPTQQGEVPQAGPTSPGQGVTAEIEIARPRATVKPSLLDVLPGQLLPPPSGKQARDGWTPSKFTYQGSGPSSSPPSSPEEDTPTSPLSPEQRKTPSPPPLQQEEVEEEQPKEDTAKEEVVYRVNRRSGERPRSTGDVKIDHKSEASSPSTPGDEESQSSVSSEGRKDPPPPPPRNKKGHSRSSSLDLNKLFATKAKENKDKGTPPSSSSSFSSQTGDSVPPARSEPSTPRRKDEITTSNDKLEANHTKVEKQEDFADFSRFESFVEAQGGEAVLRRGSSPRPSQHRRSFSLDHSREVWSKPSPPQKPPSEAVATTPSRPAHNQEALPRPVPKLKPPSPPTLKQGRRSDKDADKERKLKTEPPRVIVRPLTKEDKLNSRISDLKEKNAALSKVNSELQQELKTIKENRAMLELKLEKLKLPSTQKEEMANKTLKS